MHWGWSSRKLQCVGTSSGCFKSLQKKKRKEKNNSFLFQVMIPAGGDGGFFWSFGGSLSLTANWSMGSLQAM